MTLSQKVLTGVVLVVQCAALGLAISDFKESDHLGVLQGSRAHAITREAPRLPDSLQQVRGLQQQWASHWTERNAHDFLALYHPEFPGLQEFAELRSTRMRSAQSIQVRIENLTLTAIDQEKVLARFVQHYRSDTHQDTTTKEMVWLRTDSSFRVIAERAAP